MAGDAKPLHDIDGKNAMNYKISGMMLILVAAGCGVASGMTLEEAAQRLKGYEFGQDTEMLTFLHEEAVNSFADPGRREQLNKGLCEVLTDSKTSYAAKQYACRLLALTATGREVPVLAGCLPDPQMSHMALYALAHIQDPAVDQVLLEALAKADEKVRIGIITTLGNRKSRGAAAKLAELLDGDSAMAEEAVKSLGKIGTEAAAEAIQAAIAEKRMDAALLEDAYLNCADQLTAKGNPARAAEMYLQIYQTSQTNTSRGAALVGLAGLQEEDSASYIVKAFTSGDTYLIPVAARLAQQYPGQDFTVKLCEALPGMDAATQVLVIQALAVRADKAALATLRKTAAGSGEETVRAAIEVLGQLGDASDVKLLAGKAAGGGGVVGFEAEAAKEALHVLSGDHVIERMIGLLDETDGTEKVILIETLTVREAHDAVRKLVELLDAQEPAVRKACWKGLGVLGQAENIPVLVDKLLTARMEEQKEAENAVVAIARHSGQIRESTNRIMEKLETAREEPVRCRLLRVLGEIGDPAALEVLRSGLGDEQEQVRETALRALAGWPTAEPMNDLLAVAEKSKSHLHRILALRGYIEMVDKAAGFSDEGKIMRYQAAMKLAGQAAEQKKVLAAVSKIPALSAFQMAAGYRANSVLKEEAAIAACTIAKNIYMKQGQEIKKVLSEIAADRAAGMIADQAGELVHAIDTLQDYLVEWEVSGPYVQERKSCQELFDIPFAPEIEGEKAEWRPMPAGTDASQPWFLDLLQALNGGDQRVAYLRTTLRADADGAAVLLAGSDDGIKIWLNGLQVFANNTMRPFVKDQDQVEVKLLKGENRLLLKVTQNNQGWGASIRLIRQKQTS